MQVPLSSSQFALYFPKIKNALLFPKFPFIFQKCPFVLQNYPFVSRNCSFIFQNRPFYFPEGFFCFLEVPFYFSKIPYYFPELPFRFPELPSVNLLCASFSKNAFFPADCAFSSSWRDSICLAFFVSSWKSLHQLVRLCR